MPQKEVLYQVREYIVKNSKELDKLVSDKEFVSKFGELRGEKNKVLPKNSRKLLKNSHSYSTSNSTFSLPCHRKPFYEMI